MAGLKPTVPKQLREQGIEIFSCVDNDDAGRKFENENGFKRSDGVKALLDNNENANGNVQGSSLGGR